MARHFTKPDIELLGYSDADEAEDSPPSSTVYRCKMPGLRKSKAVFAHLKTGSSEDSAKELYQRIRKENATQAFVVIPDGMSPKLNQLRLLFGTDIQVFVHDDIIWEHVYDTFKTYLEKLASDLPSVACYIPPRPKNDAYGQVDQLAVQHLAQREKQPQHEIMAVLASAGIGKTTLAREVARQLAQSASVNRIIPVYVEAAHWAQIAHDLDDFWSVIGNSLHKFDPSLPLSERLFRHLLANGDVAFIFDGFDELCSRSNGAFAASEVLDELAAWSKDSAARLLVTSRTMYWEAEIGQERNDFIREELKPFTKQQALAYYDKRFVADKKLKDRALTLFHAIRGQNQPTSGPGSEQAPYHPYVVDLVGTAAERGVDNIDGNPSTVGSEMYSILTSFCSRETLRQGLKSTAKDQMDAFEALAIDDFERFSLDDLVMAGIQLADREKLNVHPLLTPSKKTQDHLEFKYEYIGPLLRARHVVLRLIEAAQSGAKLKESVVKTLRAEASGRSSFFDHVLNSWPKPIDPCVLARLHLDGKLIGGNESKSFIFHVAKGIIDKRKPASPRAERTTLVFSALCTSNDVVTKKARDLVVTGVIENLDLRGWSFEKCKFTDVAFTDCEVDETTSFESCDFAGKLEITGSGWGKWALVKRAGCNLSAIAQMVFADTLKQETLPDSQAVQEVVALALGRFWRGGRLITSIRGENWRRGPLGKHRLCDRVLEVLIRHGVVEEIRIPSVQEGGIALIREAIPDIQRFMDNRQVSGRLISVVRSLTRE